MRSVLGPFVALTLGVAATFSVSARSLVVDWSPAETEVAGYRLYLLTPGNELSTVFDTDAALNKVTIEDPLSGFYRGCVSTINASGVEGPCGALAEIWLE